jgi:DNA-binding NarL/FixJ family response regulator
VGEAGCAATAVEAAMRLAPDAVLLDICLGDASGFDVAWELRTAAPDAAVLLTSNLDYRQSRERVRFCGARGFVLKSELATGELGGYWPENSRQPGGAPIRADGAPGTRPT